MSILLDELKPLRLYKGKFYYPIDEKNRMNNSIIYLLTPDTKSSISIMNNEFSSMNRIMFKSYFIEKNVQFVINNAFTESTDLNINNEEVAMNYSLYESLGLENTDEDVILTESGLSVNNENNKSRIYFPEYIDSIFDEASVKTKYGVYNFDTIFRKMLYNERMKTQKDCILFYDNIKKQVPFIQYTYVDNKLYKNKNLYYDWSYYTESYYKNMPKGYTGDRAIDMFFDYMNRFLKDSRFNSYSKRTIVIPVNDWTNGQTNIFDYKVNNTPISMLWRTLRDRLEMIKNAWSGYTILFLSNGGYFTMNMDEFNFSSDFSKFTSLTKKFHDQDFKDAEDVSTTDSKKSILIQLSDKLEKDGNIKIHNISGGTSKVSKKELEDMGVLDDPSVSNDPEVKKAALVNKMSKIASKSINADDAAKELENPEDKNDSDWLKDLLVDLQSEEGIKMNAARKSRMNQTKEEILTKEINGKTVGDLLKQFKENDDIPEESIPIETIDDNWKHVKFTNFNKVYDMEPDIVAMFTFFQNVTHPMNVLSINKENTSTSEDYKDTWTCKYEDAETGKRQTMKLDIPRMIGNRFMKLRGNEKVLIGQLMLLPIIKTGDDTVQVVSNYNKIFVTRKSPSGLSKSTPIVNKLCKVLDKYEGKNIIPRAGDNRKICIKYELPMEFVDISSLYAKIEFPKDNSYISFNMDDLSKIPFNRDAFPSNSPERKMTDEELNKKYLAVYVKDGKKDPIINQSFDSHILSIISQHDDEDGKFEALYRSTAVAKRLMYSEASILNTKIPVSVVLSYNIGLQRLLDKMKVNYEFSETRPAKGQSYIKFIDGYLAYSETTSSQNMMLNGLMECDFSSFSIKEINSKDMWLSILDNFGGRIKADGLDNFYDLMFDPITKEICNTLGIPGTYVEALIYANDLLIDNKFNKHTDVSGNRLRTNEVIVGHLYLILSKAFGAYRNMIKRNKGSASFSAKISAVIDSILNHDQTSSDLSTLTPLLEAEAASKVTFKGLSGMNSERAFSIDKRTYDKSMLGILGLSTGFASTVGINRQTTIDAGVINKRGFMKTRKPEELGNIKTFTVMEALSPMAVNHDDPIRTCMAFTQTVQHQMTVKRGMPNLVTTGCDEALPYITSDKFSYKFHGKKGTVIDLTDEYMVVQDDDTKQCDYVDLRELIQKNSDGGFYVTTKLDPIVKKGQKVRENDILAYDKKCYSNAIGGKGKDDNISYNIGTLGKVAIMDTDLGYEDSCVVDTTVSEALASEFVVQKEINIPKDSNVYDLVKIGQIVQEGDPLMVFQDSFDEKEANEFLKSISSDNETLSDLGRKQIHAKVTGVIQDIKIYRTCEINQLSETLQKVCKNYDTKINKLKSVMSKYGVDKQYTLESTGKLPAEGKLKALDGVKIEFYIKVNDKFGIGDKLVFSQALKGVNSYIIPRGQEAYTDFRPNEHINAFLTVDGVMARMVSSANSLGLLNKIIIELSRASQSDLGIKWRPLQEILQNP